MLSVPHPLFREVGHAFVEPKPGVMLNVPERGDFLKPRLASYLIPERFSFEPLPLLPNSKIDKRALKAKLTAQEEKAA